MAGNLSYGMFLTDCILLFHLNDISIFVLSGYISISAFNSDVVLLVVHEPLGIFLVTGIYMYYLFYELHVPFPHLSCVF